MRGFHQRSKGGDLGKSKVLGLEGVIEVSYHFYYSLRGRVLSYFGFTSTFLVDLKELFKRLFEAV